MSLAGRNAERLAEVGAICREKGASVHTLRVDVTDAEATETWLLERDQAHPIDLLIACTGIGGAAVVAPKSGETGAQAREIFAVNTIGVVNTVTPILPRMIARRSGHIVLVGSIQAMIGMPQSPVYCASKAAVKIYGDGLRRLARQHGVRVTNVLPGFIDTPMSRSLDLARPWCWSADKAAARIARDVARGAAQSVFPWPLRLSIGLQSYLPIQATDWVMSMIARAYPVTATQPEPQDPGD
jgi:short-subunit dehydrogenase